ncbi:MAG: energy transducer TonB [Deltaproteobacteria bacterium]|nr:energy transducer TonB [Deltaproteobacteria bacterium]
MRPILWAALFALLIHGLFFGFVSAPARIKPSERPRFINISLVSHGPAESATAKKPLQVIKKALPTPEERPGPLVRPAARKKAVKPPDRKRRAEKPAVTQEKRPEPIPRKKPAVTHKKKSVREHKKKASPRKAVARPRKRPAREKKAAEQAPERVMASLTEVERKAPVPPPPPHHGGSGVPEPDTPLEKIDDTGGLSAPFPPVPLEDGAEKETRTAAIPPAKAVREARPSYKDNPAPPYPRRARKRGYQGTVLLKVLVGRDGRVRELRVQTSSGHSILDRAAVKAVKQWIFEPGTVGNERVEMWVRVPVRFELKGG